MSEQNEDILNSVADSLSSNIIEAIETTEPAADLSVWFSLWIILLGVSLFIGFYILDELVIKLIRNRRIRATAKRVFPIATSIIWACYALYIIFLIVVPYPIFGVSMVVLLLLAFWWFIKDFVGGLIIRIQNDYKAGQKISLDRVTGVITQLGTTKIEVESEDGESLLIPYSDFTNQLVTKPSVQEQLKQFTLKLPKDVAKSREELVQKVWSCPWIVSDKDPRVQFLAEEEGYRVTGYTLDLKYVDRIRRYFK